MLESRELPELPNTFATLSAVITRADGRVEHIAPSHNARVDSGAAWQAALVGGSSAAASMSVIALSPTTLTPAKGDTGLSGEYNSAGLTRAIATYGSYTAPSTLGGGASYQITHTFTCTTNGSVVASSALFNTPGGTMFNEANFAASIALNNGDTCAVVWAITI